MDRQRLRDYSARIGQTHATGKATELSYRADLQWLLEAMDKSAEALHEPKRVACGAPDYAVMVRRSHGQLTVGHVEAKDVPIDLDGIVKTDQLRRYRASLDNLVLTNYLEFRWYVGGQPRLKAQIGRLESGRIVAGTDAEVEQAATLLSSFLAHAPEPIASAPELAKRMAKLTHAIRDIIVGAFENDEASDLLRGWREAFARVLISGLDQPEKTAEFADMFAQTLSYGLFAARVADPTPASFSREEAQKLIPRTNPFLRQFFGDIAGFKLDDEPFVGFVDDLVRLLADADMGAILRDFGKRTRQEDPVVHFYETFLAHYDPKLREARGVYYTPEPVVSYIVRSVDHLLKTRFGLRDGLADTAQITVPNADPGNTVKGKRQPRKTDKMHRVLVLDPAVGTGTFLYEVVDLIRERFMRQGSAGLWSQYVREHLLPRLFGFELLMAPYAVAHFKLGLQLAGHDLPEAQRAEWAYDFKGDERIGVYLTNSLEPAHELTGLPLFTQWVADETNAANEVKARLPIMVVIGNPPYSNFGMMNRNPWIRGLLEDYKRNLNEKKLNLDDDFIKFIRFGQWRIEQTGQGILAFITNNTYIDGITHRRMRESLMETFTDIYVLDLHGSVVKKDRAPDGSSDENVFDIQQGVAIAIFVKDPRKAGPAQVHHGEMFGTRANKYRRLSELSLETSVWTSFPALPPQYFFREAQRRGAIEYDLLWSVSRIFAAGSSAVETKRDSLFVAFDRSELQATFQNVLDQGSNSTTLSRYDLRTTPGWSPDRLTTATYSPGRIAKYWYRPFDWRYIYYDVRLLGRARYPILRHMLLPNLALVTLRQTVDDAYRHVCCVDAVADRNLVIGHHVSDQLFPLYRYESTPEQESLPLLGARCHNISDDFIDLIATTVALRFVSDGPGDVITTFGPEDVFAYIYAILHSPTYRTRYAEFLKIDFPRIPLTRSIDLFRALVAKGSELVALHLLKSPRVDEPITRYPVSGDNIVAKGHPRYDDVAQRVYINADDVSIGRSAQYFEGVAPEVWRFHVGGYQVCEKWLKDRRGRALSYEDLRHYGRVVVALSETIRLMGEIDAVIPGWPIA